MRIMLVTAKKSGSLSTDERAALRELCFVRGELRWWLRTHWRKHVVVSIARNRNGSVVGWSDVLCRNLDRNNRYWRDRGEVGVYVDSRFRHRGIAASLLRASLRYAATCLPLKIVNYDCTDIKGNFVKGKAMLFQDAIKDARLRPGSPCM